MSEFSRYCQDFGYSGGHKGERRCREELTQLMGGINNWRRAEPGLGQLLAIVG